MASIIKRGNKWVAQWYGEGLKIIRKTTGIDVVPKDGKSAARNKKQAQQVAELMERHAKGQIAGAALASSLRSLADTYDDAPILTAREYLTTYRPSGKEQNQSNARRAVKRFLDYLTARKQDGYALADVKPKVCDEFLGAMLRDVSTGTVMKYKQHLSTAFNQAVREELIKSNPFALLRIDQIINRYAPETKGRDKTEREAFTAEEMRFILFELPQPWRDLAAVSFYTGGQRIGDCCLLTWEQVDFERGLIHFVTQKTAKRITHPLRDELRRRLEARKAAATDKEQEHVFPTLAHQYSRAASMVSTQFTSLLRSHGIIQESAPRELMGKRRAMVTKSFHCIRHTVVSTLRGSNQVSADICRAVVGHDSETVERAYFTAPAEDINRAFDVLEKYVSSPDASPHACSFLL